MKELRAEVNEVMENELKRANDRFPLFRSDHEGISVIKEEVMEADDEFDMVLRYVGELEKAVFKDKPIREKHSIARNGIISALSGACELIQVAAMFNKFRISMDQKNNDKGKSAFMDIPQKELNRIVDELFDGEGETTITKTKRKCMRVTPEQAKRIITMLEETEAENER